MVFLPSTDGPGRLLTLVGILVSGLPADCMIPGVIRTLLECSGYQMGGPEGVIIRAEHGGELKADLSAFVPQVMRLGVMLGIVKPPASDISLSKLPRQFPNIDGLVGIKVHGHFPKGPSAPPPRQQFIPARQPAPAPPRNKFTL